MAPALTPESTRCPLCNSTTSLVLQRHSLTAAAEHFVPTGRDPVRRARLEANLRRLWGGREFVEVRRCESCGFGFAAPHVAGDKEFYNLVSNADAHYPARRWEFDRTIAELSALPQLQGELLECGAGGGSFLAQLGTSTVGARYRPMAAELDEGAIRRLRAAGIAVSAGSITEFGEDMTGRFAVICMFQTLEHHDDAHAVFEAFRRLGRPGSHIFVSVPNAAWTDTQERRVRYWDMPPNHVGRWTGSCFSRMAVHHGLRVVGFEVEPASKIGQTWRLALSWVNSRAYEAGSLAGKVNMIRLRLVRGVLKRSIAALLFLRLWSTAQAPEGDSLWVHMRNPG
jgi:SAM-dependent methyltransferase